MNWSNRLRFDLFVFGLTIILLAYSIINGLYHGNVERHFEEGRLMTFYSSFQLVAIALLSWLLAEREQYRASRLIQVWTLIAFGFLFLAFDDALEFHEEIDFKIHQWLGMRETGLTDRIDDLIVFSYLIAGLFVIVSYRDDCIYYLTRNKWLIGFAITLIIYMVIADILGNRADIITNEQVFEILTGTEEITKILAESLLLITIHRIWCDPRPDS